jgi:hypothetical protein
MAITSELTPDQFNLAYGQNLFAFTGITNEDKYAIRVKQGVNILADLRQSRNASGDAVFDIQNIIQSYVQPSKYWVEQLGIYDQDPGIITANLPFTNSENEVFGYNLEYGYETSGVYTGIATLSNFRAIGGSKMYYENYWKYDTWRPRVAGDGTGCTETTRTGEVLTNWNNLKQVGQLSGGYPTRILSGSDQVLQYNKQVDHHLTNSYFNDVEESTVIAPPVTVNSIEAFQINVYNGNTLVQSVMIPNIIRNGGGPNTDLGDGATLQAEDLVITMGTGPANLDLMRYYNDSTTSIQIFNLASDATHYYISTHAATDEVECTTEWPGIADQPIHRVVRVDIVPDNCFDYEPLEVSWQNSFGFRDYYVFNKRQQQSISVTRNDYLADDIGYSGPAADAGANYGDRGYTTYSQKIQEKYLANTDYMQDFEATYLRNLYQSPDTRVRLTDKYSEFNGVFWPVNLLSSGWTEKNYRKDKLFQYEIQFKLANNIKSMRG